MKVKFKKIHPDALIPSYAKPGDFGLDLTAVSIINKNAHQVMYDTGIAVEIPDGYGGFVFPRSSVSNRGLDLSNSTGVIDSQYRGSIRLVFNFTPSHPYSEGEYKVGERIGQLIILPYPIIEPVESDTLSETERGAGGFGSTGK